MANKDTLIKMFEGIRDERTKHANTARRIGNAFLSMLDFASSAGDGKLSSVHDDIAQGFITFVKGLMVNQLAQLKGGASFGSDGSYSFDKDGNLVIESARSRDFDEMLQNGFALKRNPTSGKYTLSISDLIVWGRMVINTLEVRKKYAIGGNVYLSGASSKIQHVEKVYSEDGETVVGYKCYILKDDGTMATQNGWVVGDQALCQTFDIEEGVYQNVSNQYYWRLVTQVSEENVAITEKYIDKDGNEQIRELYEGQKFAWVVLSKDDCDTNSGIPASGDTIVLDGHRLTENEDTDYTERTNVLMLEATGSGSPRIIALTGVVDYKHTTDNEVFILSPRKVIFTTEHFEIRTASGAPITFVHFMGPWEEGTEYHYYDQVSHADALWTCIVEKGKSTTAEPTDDSTYWRKEMSGGKGEKGDDAVSYSVQFSVVNGSANGVTSQLLYVTFTKAVGSNITSGTIEKIGFKGRVMVYVDGVENGAMSDVLNRCYPYIDISNAFAGMIEGKKNLSVKLIDTNGKVVASSIFFFAEKGDKGEDGLSGNGIVPAYIRSEDNPTLPTSTDKNNLDNGWSLAIPSVDGVKNVSYNDSSWTDYNDGGYTWKKSPTTAASSTSPCLVTFTTTKANQAVKFVLKAFSEINYDYIFLSEIDASGVPSKPGYSGTSRAVSGNGVELSVEDIVVAAGTHTVYVCYGKDGSNDDYGDYGLFRIENIAGIPLWQSNGKEVFARKDSGAIKSEIESWSEPFRVTGEDGADGKDGTDGEDAYRVEVSPATLVFDTSENGFVASSTLSGKYATVTVYKGNQKISANNLSLPSNYETKKSTNVTGSISNVDGEARITISRIETETISEDVTVSKSSGQISFPIDVFGEQSTLMWATVNVQVNVAKFTGTVVANNKQYESKFEEISTRFDNTPTNKDLTDAESRITQTAREISLSVSEKTIGRRNLLVGSAFLRDDNNVEISDGARIEMNSGYQGTNCIHIVDDTDGTPHYPGAFWDGSQGGKSIEITKGKKYIISCWYMTNDVNGHLYLEALYTDKQTNAKRKGGPNYLSPSAFTVKKVNEWELFTAVIDTTDAQYNYLAFNFFESCNGNCGCIDAWICRPMVEEGEVYNGWTLSEKDYDIIGANLIDNSRTLDAGGNIVEAKGKKTLVGDSYELTASGSNDYNTFYRIKGSTFKLGVDYTISFDVRGDAKYMGAYVSYPVTNTKFTCYKEPQNGAMFEATGDGSTVGYVALIEVKELSKQQRVWAHFRFKDRLPEELYFQFPKNAEQTDVTSWNVTITRPKIEVGAVVTEYTERKSDLVDKASLKAAGINITSDMVELYGNQVKVSGAKGGTPVAMFEDGMLNANLINAYKIIAKQLQTAGSNGQSVSIEDGLLKVYGTNGVCNIEFGVNSNGEAILSYYNKDGKWLYDLGPDKLDGGQLTESTLNGDKYVTAASFLNTNDNFFELKEFIGVTVKQVLWKYSTRFFGNNSFIDEDQEVANNSAAHIGYKPFEKASGVTALYRYTAPRQSGTIISDKQYGLTTPALAKQADGKYFTSNSVLAINGQLTNLAPAGYYFRQSEQVKMAPYPMPSAETQSTQFPAYSIRYLNIAAGGIGTVMNGFQAMMSYLTRAIKQGI